VNTPEHLRIFARPERHGLRAAAGALYIEDVALTTIAARFGTPTYVYGAGHVLAQLEALRAALVGQPTLICYAVKANSNQAILRVLARAGAGADIVSLGELQRALAAGFAPGVIVFSGVGKLDAEIDAAISARIKAIHVESQEEVAQVIARARALGQSARVALRVNPDIDPVTHPYLATGLRESKFGIAMAEALTIAQAVIAAPELELVGIACHIGSQIVDAGPFLAALGRLREVIRAVSAAGARLTYVDLGGGLGIPYTSEEATVDVPAFGAALAAAMAGTGLELLLEPGRFLVGNAGALLTRVVGRKVGEDRSFVIVDAAMNDLIRPALYDAYHAIVPCVAPPAEASAALVDVVGPVCECGDFFARGRTMVVPDRGELLAILGAGAYGMSMASTYNSRPLAAEVLVAGEQAAGIRRRQTIESLMADERMPPWLR
jgi:diaminopimelate decarboxylase